MDEPKKRISNEGRYHIPEDREYRIYVSSRGEVPVLCDIYGDEHLAIAKAVVAAWFPKDTIFVREVIELVREVLAPTK